MSLTPEIRMYRYVAHVVSCCLLLAATASTSRAQSESDSSSGTVGAQMRLLRDIDRHVSTLDGAMAEFLPTPRRGDGAVATLRFETEPSDRDVASLRSLGLEFEYHDGELLHVGPIYQAFVPWSALDALRARDDVVRVEATWAPSRATPLDETSRTVGARRVRRRPDLGYDGEGVLLGDIDSGFDIFHPSLFRADGGYYAWRDANDNGEFDPGTDGIDLDQNGIVTDNERLEVLDAAILERGSVRHRNGTLEPDRDWLYVDLNQNGERDIGPNEGFVESTPAYGEPTFVVDDADDDGELDPLEKLVRLDSSKFKKIVRGDEVYERGKDLIQLGVPSDDARSFHGTGATSVMVGGQPGFHDRIGLAPAADVVGYPYATLSNGGRLDNGRASRQLEYMKDAIQTGVDVMLHEWTRIVYAPLDGSTNLEAAMDRARNKAGMTQINPLGNLNLSKKHLERTIEPGQTTDMTFVVDEGVERRGQTYPYRLAYGALQWTTDQTPTVTLTSPKGNEIELTATQGRSTIGSSNLFVRSDETSRGTNMLIFVLRNRGGRLPKGDWTLRAKEVQTKDNVYARITDRYSSWGVGIRWKNPTRDEGTMVFPSTADSAFGVAAFTGVQPRAGRTPGELRKYSGRGPRIDGARGADIAAPDDPFVAFGVGPQYTSRGLTHGWFRRFGGTSGASPHVAAAAAMLAQQHPKWGPDRIESRLTARADSSNLSPDLGSLPNPDWGHGRLNAFRAVTGRAKPDGGQSPRAKLTLEKTNGRLKLDASGSTDPDGDPLAYRFDYDYDGEWETAWRSDPTAETSSSIFGGAATYTSRVAVRDDRGRRDGAIASITALPPGLPGGDDTGVGGADASSDAGVTEPEDSSDTSMSNDVTNRPDAPDTSPSELDVGASPDSHGSDAGRTEPNSGDAGNQTSEDTPAPSGCSGCHTPPSDGPSGGALAMALFGVVVWRRRRRCGV